MSIRLSYLFLTFVLLLLCMIAYPQQDSSLFDRVLSFPDKVFGKLDQQSQKLNNKLTKQTEKYLSKLEKQEQKLKRKLWRTDSVKAKELFGNVEERYDNLRNQLSSTAPQQFSSVYSGHADSLTSALSFLKDNPLLQQAKGISSNLQNVTALQNKFNQTELIRKQIKARQEALKQQLQNTPLAKEFARYKRHVYYYQAQLTEYRQALNDPKLMGNKLIAAAKKIPAFDAFFKQHSELASLFALPGADAAGNSSNFLNNPNLQTRAQVGQMLQQQFAVAGGNPQQYIQQSVGAAQSQLNVLKQKVVSYGTGASDEEMPDFKPNDEKTRAFKKRIILGSNFQTTRNNTYFSITTDIAFSAGYKLNSKSIVGIGGSYKMGWGTGFNNISFTSQGAGIRSFIDWKAPFEASKIKLLQGLWISGGYEQNYLAVFRRLDELNNRTVWKQSALIGVSKVIDIRSKLFKQTKIQILYDLLWRQQLPQTQALLIRFGYNF
jgi:hypothetical protein